MPNITLEKGIDTHLKPLKEGDVTIPIQIAIDKVRIEELDGDTVIKGGLILKAPQDTDAYILLKADDGDDNDDHWEIRHDHSVSNKLIFRNLKGTSGYEEYITIAPDADAIDGTTQIKTTLAVSGRIDSAEDFVLMPTKKIIFDAKAGEHTFINESSDDTLDFWSGQDKMLVLYG